ncbi:MAG: ATP-grasp domain-containing protein [Erysipelotrichaceae bacterium]|jgi:biotin carboxylase
MNYVFLSPHFPRNFKHFVISMRKHGVNVLGIASEPYFNLDLDLRESLTEYYRVDDMEDYSQLLRACGFFTFKYGKIDFIESHNEHWLEKEAQLRTDFNVPGLKTADMPAIKRKSEMKKVFQRAGIAVARGEIINDIDSARKFVEKVGYPICAKPDIGVGAAGAYEIANDKELEEFFSKKPPVDYIMEEFIRGNIHTFDGLADRDGKILFLNSFIYSGVMEMVRDAVDTVYFNQFEIPNDLMDAGLRAIKEFGIRNRFFHLEFFRTDDGDLVALEINVRPPGGWSVDMFNYSCDISIFDLYSKMILKDDNLKIPEIKYHCAFIGVRYGQKNDLKHSTQDSLNNYGHLVVKNGSMPEIFSDVMGDYCYIIRSKDLDELKTAAEYITCRNNC